MVPIHMDGVFVEFSWNFDFSLDSVQMMHSADLLAVYFHNELSRRISQTVCVCFLCACTCLCIIKGLCVYCKRGMHSSPSDDRFCFQLGDPHSQDITSFKRPTMPCFVLELACGRLCCVQRVHTQGRMQRVCVCAVTGNLTPKWD